MNKTESNRKNKETRKTLQEKDPKNTSAWLLREWREAGSWTPAMHPVRGQVCCGSRSSPQPSPQFVTSNKQAGSTGGPLWPPILSVMNHDRPEQRDKPRQHVTANPHPASPLAEERCLPAAPRSPARQKDTVDVVFQGRRHGGGSRASPRTGSNVPGTARRTTSGTARRTTSGSASVVRRWRFARRAAARTLQEGGKNLLWPLRTRSAAAGLGFKRRAEERGERAVPSAARWGGSGCPSPWQHVAPSLERRVGAEQWYCACALRRDSVAPEGRRGAQGAPRDVRWDRVVRVPPEAPPLVIRLIFGGFVSEVHKSIIAIRSVY